MQNNQLQTNSPLELKTSLQLEHIFLPLIFSIKSNNPHISSLLPALFFYCQSIVYSGYCKDDSEGDHLLSPLECSCSMVKSERCFMRNRYWCQTFWTPFTLEKTQGTWTIELVVCLAQGWGPVSTMLTFTSRRSSATLPDCIRWIP